MHFSYHHMLNLSTLKHTLLYVLCCWSSMISYSQVQDTSRLPTSQQEVIKDFEARIESADMKELPLSAISKDTSRAFLRSYSLTTQPLTLTHPSPQIRPLEMPQEKSNRIFNGYAHLGYGIQNNPYGDLFYGIAGDKYDASLRGFYENLQSMDRDDFQMTNYGGRVQGSIDLNDRIELLPQFSYQRREYGDYVEGRDTALKDRSLVFNLTEVGLGIRNMDDTYSGWSYSAGYSYRHYENPSEFNERTHSLDAIVYKFIGVRGWKGSIDIHAEYNDIQDIFDSDWISASLTPTLSKNSEDWYAEVGLRVLSNDDDLYWLPHFHLTHHLLSDVDVYASVTSKYEAWNYHYLTMLHPFARGLMFPSFQQKQVHVTQNYSLGCEYQNHLFSAKLQVGYIREDDAPLHLREEDLFESGDLSDPILIGSGPFDYWNIQLDLASQTFKNLRLNSSLNYAIFNEGVILSRDVYSRPSLQWRLSGEYEGLLNNRLSLGMEIQGIHGIRYRILDRRLFGYNEKLPSFFGLNTKASYDVSDWFKAYLAIDNVLDDETDQWFGYQRLGINARIGAELLF